MVTRGCRLQKGQDLGGEIRHTVARFLENRLSLSMLAKKHPSLTYAIRQAFAIKLARFLSDISFLHSTPFFYQLHTQATSKPLSTANTAYRLLEWAQVTFLHLEPSKNPLESPTLLLPLFTPLHFTPPGIIDPAFPTSHFSYIKLLNPTCDSPISYFHCHLSNTDFLHISRIRLRPSLIFHQSTKVGPIIELITQHTNSAKDSQVLH